MEVSIYEEGVVCKAGLSVISGAATPKQREGGLAVLMLLLQKSEKL